MCDPLDEFVRHMIIWSPLFLWAAFGLWWESRQGREG